MAAIASMPKQTKPSETVAQSKSVTFAEPSVFAQRVQASTSSGGRLSDLSLADAWVSMTEGDLDDDDKYDVWYDAMDLLTKPRNRATSGKHKAIARDTTPRRAQRWRLRKQRQTVLPAAARVRVAASSRRLAVCVPSIEQVRSKRLRGNRAGSPTATPPLRRPIPSTDGEETSC